MGAADTVTRSARRAGRHPPERRSSRLLRGVSGVLAGGMVGLFLALLGGWAFTTRTGSPGPGTGMLVAHGLAAAAAVGAQIVADRRVDRAGTFAALGVIVLVVAMLAGFWLF